MQPKEYMANKIALPEIGLVSQVHEVKWYFETIWRRLYNSLILSRPEGAVGIMWVYIGVFVKEWWCPKGGKDAIYMLVCGLCVARDKPRP
jgi:hypothetical protein